MRRTLVGIVLSIAAIATACGDSEPSANSSTSTTTRASSLQDYEWQQVLDRAPWGARAGLRVVEDGDALFVMGGRTPRASNIPGDSELWGDVWQTEDDGQSWTEVVSTGDAWPARAYFQAVTMDGEIYVLGGQNFAFPSSTFYNDVWKSADGTQWEQVTDAAPWAGRAGLMAAVLDDTLYVFGGSRNDDSAVVGPTGPAREYFADAWKSTDGKTWTEATEQAPWEPRAGGAVVVKDGAIYLFGGEAGFVCTPEPDCVPPYFNDVWKTTNGKTWTEVTPAAAWSPRPGHQCELVDEDFVCFGGFGQSGNPDDMWTSRDGENWNRLEQTPWNAESPEAIRYDFDSTTITRRGATTIVTVGGDRETFDFSDSQNYLRVDDDVWWFTPVGD